MPLVPASGYTVPTAPSVEPLATPPDAYQRINAPPGAFGAGMAEGMQSFGQSAEKAAGHLFAQQQFLNLTEADKLGAQLDDELHRQKYGDPTAGLDANGRPLVPGFKNRLGSDAIDYIKSGEPAKAFATTIDRIAAGASSNATRQMFLQQSRARRAQFDNALDDHFSSQLLQHNKQVQEAKGALATREAASGFDDDNAIRGAADKLYDSYVAQSHTSDPTVLAQLRQKADGDAAHPAIAAAIAAGDADRARRLFERHGHNLSGEQQATMSKAIEVAGEQQRAKDEKQYGEDYERYLNGEGPRPQAPGARTRGGAGGRAAAAEHYNTAISLGASPNEAALLTSAAGAESSFNPNASHDGGIGYGLYGHNADRLAAMQKQFGPRPTAAQQIEFALKELRSRPEGARVNQAKTPEELTELQFQFERPKRGPGDQAEARLESTRELMRNPPGRAGAPSGGAAPSAAPVAEGAKPLAVGDSIAAHTIRRGHAEGTEYNTAQKGDSTAVSGYSPQKVLEVVNGLPQERVQGKDVVLSTGLSNSDKPNDPAQQALVVDQISALMQKGAKSVTVLGVGTAAKFEGRTNDLIKTTVSSVPGARFAGPLPAVAGDKIHSSDPRAVVRSAMSGASTAPPRAAPAASAGADEAVPAPPAAAAREPGAAPDWAGMAQKIRDSGMPPGAQEEAFRRLQSRKQMFEFGKEPGKELARYNAQVHAAVEQRTDEIVQAAVRSDDPAAHQKAQQDLANIVKWGADTGAIPPDKAAEFERKAKASLITGRAQYLDATGKPEEALAFIQQNKDALPPSILQEQVRNLTTRAEARQGERFERDLHVGAPGQTYMPGMPGELPQPGPLVPSRLQQRLQAIADSDLPDGAKKSAHQAAIARNQLLVVGQERMHSDLEMAIDRGEAGRAEIEQAYGNEQISPAARTQMHNRLDKIEAERNARAAALVRVNLAGSGGAPLDPKSPDDKKALNYHFEQVSAGWQGQDASANAINYAAKYGLVPQRLQSAIRGGLHSGIPQQMIAAADTINKLQNRNPALIGEIGDDNDLRLATLLQTYTDAGVKPEQAAELAVSGMKVSKIERDARAESFDAERGKTKIEQHDADTSWLTSQTNTFWGADPNTVDPVMRKEFEEVTKAEYQRTGNLEASRRMAHANIQNIWGRTRVGGDLRYMKQAPEKYYGVPALSEAENSNWMNEQLALQLRQETLQEPAYPITPERLRLFVSPDRVSPIDGRPVYQVWIEHPTIKQLELVRRPDGEARVWAPDWNTSPEKQRRDAHRQSEIEGMRANRPGAPGRLPGPLGIPAYTRPDAIIAPPM